ncbi:MAG: cytochrome c biogenesis protein CcsA, partial [Planctomycetota bacterium]
MATITSDTLTRDSLATTRQPSTSLTFVDVMKWLGSLKLTVGLFAASIIIVLVGTLAQDELNMLDVKQRYFLTWIALLRFDDFVPQAFWQHDTPIRGAIPFPGGTLIGVLLMVNLLAAKATRFKMQAKGTRLAAASAFLIAGCVVAALIIWSGQNSDGLQGTPPISYDSFWGIFAGTLGVLACGSIAAGVRAGDRMMRVVGLVFAAAIIGFLAYSIAYGRLGDSSLRIVWQLTKGLGAGLILMIGCQLAFGKQGGNVLLHLGVGLLMVGQFAFGDRQLEQRLTLVEGQSTNTFVNLDESEVTFIQTEGDLEHVIAIPDQRLIAAVQSGQVIQDEELPVDVKVLKYFPNSRLQDAKEAKEPNPATEGIGKELVAVEMEKGSGAKAGVADVAAAYIELLGKNSTESLGTYLVSQRISDYELLSMEGSLKNHFDEIQVDDQSYQLGMRLHREVKPYWVKLDDVQRTNYSGTSTPRDYSSFIRIIDSEVGVDRKQRVWMNNPMRYRGETFYQSSYDVLPNGKELTGLQVVRNAGWLIPYLACSITGLGMLVHFWGTLTRFVRRREREDRKELSEDPFEAGASTDSIDTVSASSELAQRRPRRWPITLAVAAIGFFALVSLVPRDALMYKLRPTTRATEFDFYAAGKIPVQFGGRMMPLDAYARQTLKAMTNKESLPIDDAPGDIKERTVGKKLSAVQWLMEVAIEDPKIGYLPMFRIDAEEVRSEFGLPRRESKLYSLSEVMPGYERFGRLVSAAYEKRELKETLSFKEKKLIEFDMRSRTFMSAAVAFRLPVPEPLPELPEDIAESTKQRLADMQLERLERKMDSIADSSAPSIVPPTQSVAEQAVDQPSWTPFAPAFYREAKAKLGTDESMRDVTTAFGEMIAAYRGENPAKFNEAVDKHLSATLEYPVLGFNPGKVSVERWMGSTQPTVIATAIYILALVLGLVYFGLNAPGLRKSVFGMLVVAFAIHTIVILGRIYITGRAPVINLYSSAVFIGWAAVLFGLVAERIFRYGTGNVLAAVAGIMTLRVAYNLTLNVGQNDTMPVLQAVLDTQFWLTTHVISVSLGYVATLVAGVLGIIYLIVSWVGAGKNWTRDVYRCVYGASCFGILFSFVGTVLGGLWADDSWGRFWGWDPKENG